MRKRIIACSIIIILFIVFFILHKNLVSNNNKLSNKIMEYIDNNSDEKNTSILLMEDVTDFKWDKMLIYMVGSSNSEISKILGVKFKDSIDLSWGMIFIYNNKIIYKESIFRDPDHLRHRLFYVNHGQPQYTVYTPDDAIFEGSRNSSGNNSYYYEIFPTNAN